MIGKPSAVKRVVLAAMEALFSAGTAPQFGITVRTEGPDL